MRFPLILLLFLSTVLSKKLEFVQALWRHGDRAPLNFPYPNDQYTEEYWIRGWSQLTSIGMQQLHELGEYFQHQYIDTNFTSRDFSTKEVYIRSSDSDRALVSAQAFTYGMYPASRNYQWSEKIKWQPIPIHANSPGEPDLICKPTAIECKKHDELVKIDEQKWGIHYNSLYADLFSELSGNTTGIPNCTYLNVNGLYDVTRELIHNLTDLQPSWVFKTWPQYDNRTSLDIITEMRGNRMISLYNSEEKSKLTGGTALYTWIQNALGVVGGNMKYKMHLYSSHDGVVLAMLNALGVGNSQMVPYAAALIMHVYSDTNMKHHVEVYYRNDTTTDAYRIRLPRCADPCEVEELARNYGNMTIGDYGQLMELCGTPINKSSSATSPSALILLLSIVIFF